MIIRIFRAQVRPGKQAEFKKCLELMTLPNIQHRSGMVAFYPGQPSGLNSDEFVLITVWRDAAADRANSNNDWARAIIPPEVLPLLQDFHIHAYQAFGIPEPDGSPRLDALLGTI